MHAVTIRYFAQAGERAGRDHEVLDLPAVTTVDAVLTTLGARHPALVPLLPHCRLAVDLAFASGGIALGETSEIAVIPPVSGG